MDNQGWNNQNVDWQSSGGQDYQGQYNYQNQPVNNQWGSQEFSNQNIQVGMNTTPVSVGEWICLYLVMMIPCVNIIMMFVWSFGAGVKESKKNFCRAQMILFAIMFVISIIAVVVMLIIGMTVLGKVNSIYY